MKLPIHHIVPGNRTSLRLSPVRLAIVLTLFASAAWADEMTIPLQYSERPPYITRAPDGSVGGISALSAMRAFRAAGIPYELRFMSTKHQIINLQANEEPLCSIAWYKTPEREAFAKFTRPISQDTPTIALANINFQAPPNPTVETLLANPGTRVLLKQSVVYGAYVESKLGGAKAQVTRTYNEYQTIVKAIRNGRADLTFATQEEADYYAKHLGYPIGAFQVIRLTDVPAGEYRHILCSRKVPDAIISRLNAALQ